MTADTIYYVIKDPNPDMRLVEANLAMFYRVKGIPPLGDHLTTLEKLAVVADIASIEAYSRISGIEKIDSAVPRKSHRKLINSLLTCARELYTIENASNHVRMSRENISKRVEIAINFQTHQFH